MSINIGVFGAADAEPRAFDLLPGWKALARGASPGGQRLAVRRQDGIIKVGQPIRQLLCMTETVRSKWHAASPRCRE